MFSNFKAIKDILLGHQRQQCRKVYSIIIGVNKDKDRAVLPVKYGGFVLFNNMIPHRRSVSRAFRDHTIDACNMIFIHTKQNDTASQVSVPYI